MIAWSGKKRITNHVLHRYGNYKARKYEVQPERSEGCAIYLRAL